MVVDGYNESLPRVRAQADVLLGLEDEGWDLALEAEVVEDESALSIHLGFLKDGGHQLSGHDILVGLRDHGNQEVQQHDLHHENQTDENKEDQDNDVRRRSIVLVILPVEVSRSIHLTKRVLKHADPVQDVGFEVVLLLELLWGDLVGTGHMEDGTKDQEQEDEERCERNYIGQALAYHFDNPTKLVMHPYEVHNLDSSSQNQNDIKGSNDSLRRDRPRINDAVVYSRDSGLRIH